MFFFFNDTATTEIYTLSLHDALPISTRCACSSRSCPTTSSASPTPSSGRRRHFSADRPGTRSHRPWRSEHVTRRSEEHTSELQSRQYLVCRLLLEKKKKYT